MFNRVFHYFHHPFWGFSPYFLVQHPFLPQKLLWIPSFLVRDFLRFPGLSNVGWDVGVSPWVWDGDSPPMQVTFSGPGLNSFIESQKQVGIFKKHQNNPRASMVAWYIYIYLHEFPIKIKKKCMVNIPCNHGSFGKQTSGCVVGVARIDPFGKVVFLNDRWCFFSSFEYLFGIFRPRFQGRWSNLTIKIFKRVGSTTN